MWIKKYPHIAQFDLKEIEFFHCVFFMSSKKEIITRRDTDFGKTNLLVLLAAVLILSEKKCGTDIRRKEIHRNRKMIISVLYFVT